MQLKSILKIAQRHNADLASLTGVLEGWSSLWKKTSVFHQQPGYLPVIRKGNEGNQPVKAVVVI